MNGFRAWIVRGLLALALLVVPAFAAAAGCGSPPDSSGDWYFVDDVALNMRLMASSPVAYGTYDTVARRTNLTSTTMDDVTMSWTGYSTVSWSSALRTLAGKRDTRERETLRVTVDIPPFKEARLRVREASRQDTYRFDAGCIWFDADTGSYRRMIADYGVEGTARRTWNASSVSIRTAW